MDKVEIKSILSQNFCKLFFVKMIYIELWSRELPLTPEHMYYWGQDPLSLTFNSHSWDKQISLERVHLNTETFFCAGKQSALLASSRLWLQMCPRYLEHPPALIILRSPLTQNSLGSLASVNLYFDRFYINWLMFVLSFHNFSNTEKMILTKCVLI